MANVLASIFGGGSQTAPQLPTYDPASAEAGFLGQNFTGATALAGQMTAATSANNLDSFTSGLNTVDPGALPGLNTEQGLGNSLLSGSMSALPSWAQSYLNLGQQEGNENAAARGVGAFSGSGMSGVNQYKGNNAMNLVKMGADFSNQASGQATGIVNATKEDFSPMDFLMSPGQFQQGLEFNTGIEDQQAVDNAAATNYNNNNSPLGNMARTGLSMLASLAGSYLGDSSLGSSFSTSGNGPGGPIQGSQSSGGGGSGGGGAGGSMAGMASMMGMFM